MAQTTAPNTPSFTLPRPSAGDVVAGVSVALVAIPQSLAYAELAGLPAQYGLYASALPSVFAAAFVSSRQLQTGPVALTALLTFGALSATTEPFSDDYIAKAALLALMVGAVRVLLGVLRMGRVAYLLSEPVLLGFTTAAAVLITASQLPKVFDVAGDDRGVVGEAAHALTHPDQWRWGAIAFAVLVAALMLGGRKLHRLFPGVLVAVLLALAISTATDYGGTIVGELDGGFVSLQLSFPWSSLGSLTLPAIAIALVGFAEPASIARTFAAEDREPWSANREFVSQGVANLVAGLSGAFPVGGSFSRSALNRVAGATSPWAGAITGLIVFAALPITTALADLPSAVLGAIVIVAVAKLMRLHAIVALLRTNVVQGLVAGGTFLATLAASPSVQWGVVIGIGLSIAAHLYRELTVSASTHVEGDDLIISPKGVVWFATVPTLDERLRACLVDHPEVDSVTIDLGAVGRLDYSGAASLARLAAETAATGVPVNVTNVPPACERAARAHLSDLM